MPSSVQGGVPAKSGLQDGSGELVGNAEGQCGPAGTCLTSYLGIFIEGERTVIVQNSVSQ